MENYTMKNTHTHTHTHPLIPRCYTAITMLLPPLHAVTPYYHVLPMLLLPCYHVVTLVMSPYIYSAQQEQPDKVAAGVNNSHDRCRDFRSGYRLALTALNSTFTSNVNGRT